MQAATAAGPLVSVGSPSWQSTSGCELLPRPARCEVLGLVLRLLVIGDEFSKRTLAGRARMGKRKMLAKRKKPMKEDSMRKSP